MLKVIAFFVCNLALSIQADPFDVPSFGREHLTIFTITNVARVNMPVYKQHIASVNPGCVQEAGIKSIEWSNLLTGLATGHSENMNSCGRMSHDTCRCTSGCDMGSRVQSRYGNFFVSENLGMGVSNPVTLMSMWIESKPHCEDMMMPVMKQTGFGLSGSFSTQLFGSNQGPSRGALLSGVDVNNKFFAILADQPSGSVKVIINGQAKEMQSVGNGVFMTTADNVPQCASYYFESGNQQFPPSGELRRDCTQLYSRDRRTFAEGASQQQVLVPQPVPALQEAVKPAPVPAPQEAPQPAPVPAPQEAPKPAPVPIPEAPKPSPVPAPQEAPQPAPVPAPQEAPKPAPVPAPQDAPKPAPVPAPQEAPKPAPVPAPQEAPQPAPVPAPQEAPKPAPVPIPEAPKPAPVPIPEAPQPAPVPAPQEAPKPAPVPAPQEAPKPAPVPAPQDAPKPAPVPVPEAPQPAPVPAPQEAPKPAPVPAPQEAPKPAPVPIPEAPQPAPVPAPQEAPKPAPVPAPQEAPKPAPVPAPQEAPKPAPVPVPQETPQAAPVPISAVTSQQGTSPSQSSDKTPVNKLTSPAFNLLRVPETLYCRIRKFKAASAPDNENSSQSSSKVGAIAGSIGALVLVAMLAGLVLVIRRRRSSTSSDDSDFEDALTVVEPSVPEIKYESSADRISRRNSLPYVAMNSSDAGLLMPPKADMVMKHSFDSKRPALALLDVIDESSNSLQRPLQPIPSPIMPNMLPSDWLS